MDESRDENVQAAPAVAATLDAAALRIGLQAVTRIAVAWGISRDELRAILGAPSEAASDALPAGAHGGTPPDLPLRVSHLVAIYGALHRLYLDHGRADAWMRRPNEAPCFGGEPPLTRLLTGRLDELVSVRGYVEGVVEPRS